MDINENSINNQLIETCSQRLPYFYPTSDQNINQIIEEKFSENLLNKLKSIEKQTKNMNISNPTGIPIPPMPSDDPIFGVLNSFSISSISLNDTNVALSAELSHLNINDADSVCPVNGSFDDEAPSFGDNPFLSQNNSTSLENDTFANTAEESKHEYCKGVKVTDWLARNDKEWIDSILCPSNADNIESYKKKDSVGLSHLVQSSSVKDLNENIEKDSLEDFDIELIPSFPIHPRSDYCAKKSKLFAGFGFTSLFHKKQNLSSSQYSNKKTSIWKKWFNRTKKTKSVSHSLNTSENISVKSSVVSSSHSLNNKPADQSFYFVYYLSNESIPFRTQIFDTPISNFTLKLAKNIIPMSSDKNYRFYFKNIIFYDCVERMFFDEITQDDQKCPFYGSEIVCKVLIL